MPTILMKLGEFAIPNLSADIRNNLRDVYSKRAGSAEDTRGTICARLERASGVLGREAYGGAASKLPSSPAWRPPQFKVDFLASQTKLEARVKV